MPGTRVRTLNRHALQRALLQAGAAAVVSEQVQPDRVDPALLTALAGIEPTPAPEDVLERLGHQVLGQRSIPRSVYEERVDRVSVFREQSLEVLAPHGSVMPQGCAPTRPVR